MTVDVSPDYVKKRALILGCGNILLGDDGFGPETVQYIQEYLKIPADVCVMDVGTGARNILFTIALGEQKPQTIVLIDAVDVSRKPGEILEIPIEDLPKIKADVFSLHQVPTVNLLRELMDSGLRIVILACQVEHIPSLVRSGLSESVKKSVPTMAKLALERASR